MPPEVATLAPRRAAFDYRAFRSDGEEVLGRAYASGELELDRMLAAEGMTLVDARPSRAQRAAASLRIGDHELVGFTNQLATMIHAGVPLLASLEHLAEHARTRGGRELVSSILARLESGASLSEALEEHSSTFSPTYVAMVRSGELSGTLPEVLRRQGDYLDWVRDVRATARQAMVYPAALCIAILGLVTILVTFLVPRLVGLFPGGEEDLPSQTRFVLAISDLVLGNWRTVVAGLLATLVAWGVGLRIPRSRRVLSRALLFVPRLGSLVNMLSVSRFATTAAALHNAGCEIVTTLTVAGQACGNSFLELRFLEAVESVRGGESIRDALARSGDLDPYLVQLTGVGESSGKLGECLQHLADGYNAEVPRAVKWTMGLIEPLVLIVGGLLVTGLLLAAILPIFKIYETLG